MANQYVNKVVVGAEVKLDLSQDTISPDKLAKDITAQERRTHRRHQHSGCGFR